MLSKAVADPSETTFTRIKEKIYKVLENEWFPDFIVSPLYHACNGKGLHRYFSHSTRRNNYLREIGWWKKENGYYRLL